MKVIFIRHAKTAGNLEKRYIGKTDEPLCEIGRNELVGHAFPDCDIVFTSPMKRCAETAGIIYPTRKIIAAAGLQECDFGDFEGKNYIELSNNSDYQKWIESGGKAAFPNGETPDSFRQRCVYAFEKILSENADKSCIAFVVHGGTIMSIMEKYAVPIGNYFDFQVQNCHGYITEFDSGKLTITEKI